MRPASLARLGFIMAPFRMNVFLIAAFADTPEKRCGFSSSPRRPTGAKTKRLVQDADAYRDAIAAPIVLEAASHEGPWGICPRGMGRRRCRAVGFHRYRPNHIGRHLVVRQTMGKARRFDRHRWRSQRHFQRTHAFLKRLRHPRRRWQAAASWTRRHLRERELREPRCPLRREQRGSLNHSQSLLTGACCYCGLNLCFHLLHIEASSFLHRGKLD